MSKYISVISDTLVKSSKYFVTHRLTFKQQNMVRYWDYLKVDDAVSIMIFDKLAKEFVLIKQIRAPIYANASEEEKRTNPECGMCYEMCAGLLDKSGKSPKETACIEIFEECGYQVDPSRLEEIGVTYGNVGISGRRMYSYYVEVEPKDKKGNGGGNKEEGEVIDEFRLKISDIDSFLFDETKPKTPLMFQAFYWWRNIRNKKPEAN